MEPEANDDVRPTLLIADDDAVVRAALSAQLAGEFDVVAVAESAGDAIALAERHSPDAALLDVDMPGGGAREAVAKIAARWTSPRRPFATGQNRPVPQTTG